MKLENRGSLISVADAAPFGAFCFGLGILGGRVVVVMDEAVRRGCSRLKMDFLRTELFSAISPRAVWLTSISQSRLHDNPSCQKCEYSLESY